MLCEQTHYRDGGTSFPQSAFQVIFFVPHPVDISELPDTNLDYLTFRNEFIMHNASMIEKQVALFSLASAPLVLSWGQVKQV
jgi:hypothetical protein